jgi:hypothetical protein
VAEKCSSVGQIEETALKNGRFYFGPNREVVAGGWRRLHNEELRNLYTSRSIIRVIEARMRWVGHVVRIGKMRNACSILVGNLKVRDHMQNLGVELIVVKWGGKLWTGCI